MEQTCYLPRIPRRIILRVPGARGHQDPTRIRVQEICNLLLKQCQLTIYLKFCVIILGFHTLYQTKSMYKKRKIEMDEWRLPVGEFQKTFENRLEV